MRKCKSLTAALNAFKWVWAATIYSPATPATSVRPDVSTIVLIHCLEVHRFFG
jgi:hypothetical protein